MTQNTVKRTTISKIFGITLLCVLIAYSAQFSVQGRTLVGYTQYAEIKNLTDAQVMVQDQNGFIWFGNYTGLHRYNGYTIKSFTNDPDNQHTLSANRITSLTIDANNTLWVGTFSGLNRYDPATQTFTRIQSTDNPQFNRIHINDITMDQHGLLWLATAKNKVVQFNPKTNRFKQVTLPQLLQNDDNNHDFWTIKQQQNGNIWIGSNLGLYQIQFDHQNQQVISAHRYTPENSQLLSPFVFNLHIDKHDNVWIGTGSGLNFIHQASGKMSNFRQLNNPAYGLAFQTISSFQLDSNNNLWISTWGGGIHQLTTADQQLITKHQGFNNSYQLKLDNLQHLHSFTTSININQSHMIYADRDNTLWILSNQTIAKLSLDALTVSRIGFIPQYLRQTADTKQTMTRDDGNFSLQFPLLDSMIQDTSGFQWFGSDRGLMRYHPKQQSVRYFNVEKDNLNSLPRSTINDIYQDTQQRIWLATPIGLVRYNSDNEDFTTYMLQDFDNNMVSQHSSITGAIDVFGKRMPNTSISAITEDNNGKLWLVSQDGLIQFTPEDGSFIHYNVKKTNYQWGQKNFVNKVYFDGKHSLWIANLVSGISLFNIKTMAFSGFESTDAKGIKTALFKEVNDIYELDGDIWLATGTGLARINQDNRIEMYADKKDGGIRYTSINKANKNILWIGTTNGMKSFDINSKQFNHYTAVQGFTNNSYRLSASFKTPDGLLYFAGNKGVEYFNPDDIKPIKNPKSVIVDNLLLANREVPIGMSDNSEVYTLPKAVEQLERISLTPKQNIFTLEFAAITTIEPENVRFAYRLKGFDDNWIETQADNRRATFTNIPSGQYQFEVKASRLDNTSSNTKWSPIESLTLVVLTPWWRTFLALTIYLVLFIAMIWATYRVRAASIIARSRQLEAQVEERTTTISKLLAQKDRMFANISHEFRTPLTLILNPIDKLISDSNQLNQLNQQQITKRHHSIKQNAQRLLRMVEQLLEFAKTESSHQQTGLQDYSLKHTVNYLNACFDSLFSSKNLNISINDFEDAHLTLKPDSLEIMLSNLISNAVKYTPENGHIDINVEHLQTDITISIKDSGIGIAPEHQQLVFERFGRVEHRQADSTQASTGIGLALVKELVNANGGTIKLTSAVNQGSCFTITLPKTLQSTNNTSEISNNSKQITALEISNLTNITTTPKTPLTDLNGGLNDDADSCYNTGCYNTSDNIPLVLVIDDNQELLELIHSIISPHFNCLLAHNGEQGIEKAQEHLPDLVISDLMMPGISGFDVLKTLKSDELTAHIPVVMLTAKGDAQSRIEGWNNQADEYLAKPFNDQELIARISNILAIRKIISGRYQQQFAQNPQAGKQHSKQNNKQESKQQNKLDIVAQQFGQKLERILAKHYQSEQLNVATIAREMAMSQRQLIRKTKSILDMTPIESIRTYRLQKATEHLNQGMAPSAIAYEVGFSSHSYFAACFKAKFGCTPSEYNQG